MKLRYNSPVIITFAITCAVAFIVNIGTAGSLSNILAVGTSVNWSNPLSILTLVTHAFGHSSVDHLLGNMTFILLLGPIVEEKYGSRQTFIMILVTSLITGVLNISFFDTGLMGASGIVFMLILLVSFTNVKSGEIPITFILVALLFVGKEVWQSLGEDNISQFAHIIGGVCGSIFGFSGKKKNSTVA